MIESGQPAPDFELPDQDGNPVRLSDLRGGLVVLCFSPRPIRPAAESVLGFYSATCPVVGASAGAAVKREHGEAALERSMWDLGRSA